MGKDTPLQANIPTLVLYTVTSCLKSPAAEDTWRADLCLLERQDNSVREAFPVEPCSGPRIAGLVGYRFRTTFLLSYASCHSFTPDSLLFPSLFALFAWPPVHRDTPRHRCYPNLTPPHSSCTSSYNTFSFFLEFGVYCQLR